MAREVTPTTSSTTSTSIVSLNPPNETVTDTAPAEAGTKPRHLPPKQGAPLNVATAAAAATAAFVSLSLLPCKGVGDSDTVNSARFASASPFTTDPSESHAAAVAASRCHAPLKHPIFFSVATLDRPRTLLLLLLLLDEDNRGMVGPGEGAAEGTHKGCTHLNTHAQVQLRGKLQDSVSRGQHPPPLPPPPSSSSLELVALCAVALLAVELAASSHAHLPLVSGYSGAAHRP
mmetsp:Transcript_7009/g.14381  ORF Transcript_7009/g.14381 Transcript_7009/m.14381 type:complete len:232 (-) Transcript_7009:190-885(-)